MSRVLAWLRAERMVVGYDLAVYRFCLASCVLVGGATIIEWLT